MSKARNKMRTAQAAQLLASRTRQRDVFGPGWIMIVLGIALSVDALAGPRLPEGVRLGLVVVLSLWAGLIGWQHWQAARKREILIAGGFLVLGGLGIVMGMTLQLPWALLLIAFALRLLFGRDR